MKRITFRLLGCMLAFMLLLSGTIADASTWGNNSSLDAGYAPGAAAEGDYMYTPSKNAVMWKCSIWAAKDDSTVFPDNTSGLANLSLSDKFYQFGETFWLYGGTDSSFYVNTKTDSAKSHFWLATKNKEEYVSEAKRLSPAAGRLSFELASANDASLKNAIYDAKALGLEDYDGSERRNKNNSGIPFVKNIADAGYTDFKHYDIAVNAYFNENTGNWNQFLHLAAKAAGYSGYESLLTEMVDAGKFTVNGSITHSFYNVDPKQNWVPANRNFCETSQVAWVMIYEPVLIFYRNVNGTYNYFAFTASDFAAANISCSMKFYADGTAGDNLWVATTKNQSKYLPSKTQRTGAGNGGKQGFVSPFLKALGKAVTMREKWFGYEVVSDTSNYIVGGSSGISEFLYLDQMLLHAGAGMRYQSGKKVSAEPEIATSASIVIEKQVTDNLTNPDFNGIVFRINGQTNETVSGGKKNRNGSVDLYADFNNVATLTVGANKTSPGTKKEITQNVTYTVEGVEKHMTAKLVFDKYRDENNVIVARCTVTVPALQSNVMRYKIQESTTPARYTYQAYLSGAKVEKGKSAYVDAYSGNTYTTSFCNSRTTPLYISKVCWSSPTNVSTDYSDVMFIIEGDSYYNKHIRLVVDCSGNIYAGEGVNQTLYLAGGGEIQNPYSKSSSGATSYGVSISDNVSTGNACRRISIAGLPEGNYVITEAFKTKATADKCSKQLIRIGPSANSYFNANQVLGSSVNISTSCDRNVAGNGDDNYVRFDNYYTTVDLSAEIIAPNADYPKDMEVITSVRVFDNSDTPVVPSDNCVVHFIASYTDPSGQEHVITEQDKENTVIPGHENNIVWFKWKVPGDLPDDSVTVKAIVNYTETINESDRSNNASELSVRVIELDYSQTPDTQYERETPSAFRKPTSLPSASNGTAKWTVWEYKDGTFEKATYAIGISSQGVYLYADPDVKSTTTNARGEIVMKSGYGFSLQLTQRYATYVSQGYKIPGDDAFTDIQYAYAMFPEFGYRTNMNEYRTLEKIGDTFMFVTNPYADGNERFHFTPLWYPDGDYRVAVIVTELWTPAGMIASQKISENINISGNAYEDWYISR